MGAHNRVRTTRFDPLKIWFPTIRAGTGTDVFTERLTAELKQRGIDTCITWLPRFGEFAPDVLRAIRPPTGTTIVHANSWNAFAFKGAAPLIVTAHHSVHHPAYSCLASHAARLYHRSVIKNYETRSFRQANAITAVSRFTAQSLERLGIDNAEVIYNWVDTERFVPTTGMARINASGPFRLLFVGNLSHRKGADLLPAIMAQLGEGYELRFTAGLRAHEIKPQNGMVALGRLSESQLIAEYQRCDALLFPSRFEGFGYSVLEAMACGKPVITSNCSSLPELVVDGQTGLLGDPNAPHTFVTACQHLASNRSLANDMGDAGRERARGEFAADRLVERYISLYRSLVSH